MVTVAVEQFAKDIETCLQSVIVQVEAGADKAELFADQCKPLLATIASMGALSMEFATEAGKRVSAGPLSTGEKQDTNMALADGVCMPLGEWLRGVVLGP